MSKTPATKHCFPRKHQTPGESALYNYMWGASRKSGIFYSDDRRDAGQFMSSKDPTKRVSKNTVTSWRQGLEKKGWIERLDAGPHQRNPVTGMYASLRYRVLTHAEWVAKYPERCTVQTQEVQPQEPVSYVEGNEDHLSQSQGQAPVPIQSQFGCTTSPNLGVPPVPTIGAKRVFKKVGKESEEEENQNAHSFSKPLPKAKDQSQTLGTDELVEVVIAAAVEVNPKAGIFPKSKAEIGRVIRKMTPTPSAAELDKVTRTIVHSMDDFQARNAGSQIAATLEGHIVAERKRAAEAERQAAVHEKEMRIVEEDIARRQQKFEEDLAKIKADEDRLRHTHHADDAFCQCERCQPEFWAEKDRENDEYDAPDGFEQSAQA